MISKSNSVGYKSVITALAGNAIVCLAKFGAFFLSGSSVMLSEAVHSVADTTNQAFLLIGIVRSEKPADESFNYGYKGERFFWSLLSACGVFFLGAGATLYHGVTTLIHHELVAPSIWSIYALIFSLFFEGFALWTAIKEIKKLAGHEKLSKFFKHSGDPTLIAIIYEDTAAITGIAIAFISIVLTRLTGMYYWDAIGSILIGGLLGLVAVALMAVNRELLIGKAIPQHIRKKIYTYLQTQGVVDEVSDFKTIMITTDGYRVAAEVEINGHYLADKIFESRDFRNEYKHIHDYEDFVKFCALFSDEVTRTLGKEIDRLEKEVEIAVPMVKHIDIEAN